jgi:hypothetical protein
LRFGAQVDRLGTFFTVGDPLADQAAAALAPLARAEREAMVASALAEGIDPCPKAPEPLRALVATLDHTPFWVDTKRAARGGRAFLGTGIAGGFALAFASLVLGYCSPAGNKPLAFSGRLRENAPRRLAETSRFVQAVSFPGGMDRFGDGFAIAVRVRLMHAQVRRMCLAAPRWDRGAWGTPINQVDMAGTVLLFSLIVCWYWIVDPGLRSLQIHELDSERRYVHVVDATDGIVARVPGCEGLRIDLGELWRAVDELGAEEA